MASDHSDAIQVKPEDLYDPSEGAFAGAPATHVDKVQEVDPNEGQKGMLKDMLKKEHEEQQPPVAEGQSEPVTHETDNVKTTYNTEDDGQNLTLKAKIKGKMEKVGDKLRPKSAVEAKNADPHPNLV